MQTLTTHWQTFRYLDLATEADAATRDIDRYPFVIRVMLENLLRHRAWGATVSDRECNALWNWHENAGADLPLYVARVILPDSSGLPVLLDLAALRDAVRDGGGDASAVDTVIPVDLIVDHSLQVDHWGSSQAVSMNLAREFERNNERYRFLKWAHQAFQGLRIFPPGTGIIHQVNLEHIAPVITTSKRGDDVWAFPDLVIGGDSHTPMINALGVLGWGVGGIDAEAALMGHAYTFPVPEVVGVKLVGAIQAPAMTTDAALLVTQRLRREKVAGAMVEFFGPAVAALPVPERATLANMAPEYGATCGYFPIDDQTLAYLKSSGRSAEQVELIEHYARRNHLFADPINVPRYSRTIEIDLNAAEPSLAGPRRPQDRLSLRHVGADFANKLYAPVADGGFGVQNAEPAAAEPQCLSHGSVVLAAITSCTNTSNPSVMLAAGLLAKNAADRGLRPPTWVKRSLAPGSRVVTRYLEAAGLMASFEALGFDVIGYGCTTCGGKSGPLEALPTEDIPERSLVAAAVLSGNRNFEGRIHKLIRANYIGSPPLVVAYAIAARITIDFDKEPLGLGRDGAPVYLRDIWPSPQDIAELLPLATDRRLFEDTYSSPSVAADVWNELDAPAGSHFAWNDDSLYLLKPPFFDNHDPHPVETLARELGEAHVLAAFGDSLTTDHISPGGEIPLETPAGQYLSDAGVSQRDFNSYVARRCNHHVMTRATFANIRIRNLLTPDTEGGFTRHFPDGTEMSIFDAAARYRSEHVACVILAGKEYGTGSSRDWAAKGSALLGVRAVIAESFERIHRANLIGMGVLPLAFLAGEGWRSLGLNGSERLSFTHIEDGIRHGASIGVVATGGNREITFQVRAMVLTTAERDLLLRGGILKSVLGELVSDEALK
jgi:aconitate hydratase